MQHSYTFNIYKKENQGDERSCFAVSSYGEALKRADEYIDRAFHVGDYILYDGGMSTCTITSSDPEFDVMDFLTRRRLDVDNHLGEDERVGTDGCSQALEYALRYV